MRSTLVALMLVWFAWYAPVNEAAGQQGAPWRPSTDGTRPSPPAGPGQSGGMVPGSRSPVQGPQPPGATAPSARTAEELPPDGGASAAPFQLTAEQQAEVDRILAAWEQRSAGVKRFACRFKRWEYDEQFGPAGAAKYEDLGTIKYEAPDKGLFRVEQTIQGTQVIPVDPRRAEHWVCDGQSVYQYDYTAKTVTEHPLPVEMRGRAIADGPLPFLFGATAASLRQRYLIRVVTPPDARGQQTWLEVYPKYQQDAANFSRAHVILTNHNMTPLAMNLYSTNGRDRTAYQFFDMVINDPLGWLKGNPFHATAPLGWTKLVEPANTGQAGAAAARPVR